MTLLLSSNYNPFDDMKGVILCNKCHKKMDSPVCQCGNTTCYIRFYWHGKRYNRRRDERGHTFTYQEAGRTLSKLNSAIDNHDRIPFDPLFFLDTKIKERQFENQIADYYRDKERESQTGELSPEYYRIINGYNATHFKYFWGVGVTEINLKMVADFKRTLDALPGIKSRKNVLNALRAFFNWLYQNGRIDKVPVFPTIKGDNSKKRRAIRTDQQHKLLELIPENIRDPFALMMETGTRPGECCAILVQSCDPDNRVVWIERTLSGHTYRETTKENTKLPVPLNDVALEIVKRNMKGKFPLDFLFVNPVNGRGFTYRALYDVWVKYTGNDIRPYEATRHSFCTQVVPLTDGYTAQRLMRHADKRSTDNYYHAYSDKLLDVVQRKNNVTELKKIKKNPKEK